MAANPFDAFDKIDEVDSNPFDSFDGPEAPTVNATAAPALEQAPTSADQVHADNYEPDTLGESLTKVVENTPERFQNIGGGLMQIAGDDKEAGMVILQPFLDAQKEGREPGFTDYLKSAYNTVTSGALNRMMFKQAAGDDSPAARFTDWLSNKGREISAEAKQDLADNQARPDGFVDEFITDVARGTIDMGPMLTAGFVAKNPNIALLPFATQVAGQTYADRIEKGVSETAAFDAVKFNMLAEVLPEKLPVDTLLKHGTPFVKRFINSALGEGAQETLTSVLQQTYDNVTLENMSLKDAILNIDWQQAGYEGLVGSGVGATLSIPASAADAVTGKPKYDQTPGAPIQPTHKVAGGIDAQPVTKNGKVVPDTYIDATGKVHRDPSAVEQPYTAPVDINGESLDAAANMDSIKAEVMGDTSTPDARQGIINSVMNASAPELVNHAAANQMPLGEVNQESINKTMDQVKRDTLMGEQAGDNITGIDEDGAPIYADSFAESTRDIERPVAVDKSVPTVDTVAESKPSQETGKSVEGKQLNASGKYSDGSKWDTVYTTEQQTDDKYVLVREITDEDGVQVSHLREDGGWQNGLPPKTAMFAAGTASTDNKAESFLREEDALSFAKDDVSDIGGSVISKSGKESDITPANEPEIVGMAEDGAPIYAKPELSPQEKAQKEASSQNIDAAAHEAATSPKNNLSEPSKKLKENGKYKKGTIDSSVIPWLKGLKIMIENPAGSKRNPQWPVMKNHYGYFQGTEAFDGDEVDVLLSDDIREDQQPGVVHVVDQINPKTGKFDEHKVILGAASEASAKATYDANYSKNWKGFAGIQTYAYDDFKAKLKAGFFKNSTPARKLKKLDTDQEKPNIERNLFFSGKWNNLPDHVKSDWAKQAGLTTKEIKPLLDKNWGDIEDGGIKSKIATVLEEKHKQHQKINPRLKDAPGKTPKEQALSVKAGATTKPVTTGSKSVDAATTTDVVAEKDQYQDFLGTGMQAANRQKTLNREATILGEKVIRKDFIESKVADGWVMGTHNGKRIFDNGREYVNDLQLTKTGMDYAEHLLKTEQDIIVPRDVGETIAKENPVSKGKITEERRGAGENARKLYEQLTKKQLIDKVLEHELTGIKGRKAFVVDVQDADVVVSIDADSLKWVNDNLSPDHGDALLQAVADSLEAETDGAYHVSGDEFYVLTNSFEEGQKIINSVMERLANAEIVATKPDGKKITLNGLNITYGLGETKNEADAKLKQQKIIREETGERAARGEQPSGAVIATAGGQRDKGNSAEITAESILNAANVTGTDRLDVIAKFRDGTYTLDDLRAAYPAVKDSLTTEKPGKESKPGQETKKVDVDQVYGEKGDYIPDMVGEKIGGARKDVWSGFREQVGKNLSQDELETLPLSKSFPEPNYKALAENGADKKALAAIKVMRDEIPTKGRSRYKKSRYVDAVKLARSTANSILESAGFADKFIDGLRKDENLSKLADRIDLLIELGFPESGINLKGVTLEKVHYTIWNGEKNVTKWVVDVTAKSKKSFGGMGGNIIQADTREEAVAALKKYAETMENQPKGKRVTKFDVYKYHGAEGSRGWIIGKKIGRNHADLVEGFKTSAEARAYVNENQQEVEDKLARFKAIPKHRKDINTARLGEDYRGGKNVTAEEFADTFGFRGVEFGNWVGQSKRQQDINDAYDGLMDLAKLLDIPPKALSLNGELGLAFGARGIGGKHAAKAHYEKDKIVINLTKKDGAGSLAHEWFHGLDNYFSRMRGEGESFVTERPRELLNKSIRSEMVAKFKGISDAIKESGLPKRARILDGKRTKDYWGTMREMAARSFESYVVSKLKEKDISNDYLANIVSQEYWEASEALGMEEKDSYPYAQAEELDSINGAYDEFFNEVKTKETDKGVALFSRGTTDAPALGTNDVKIIVADLKNDVGAPITVVDTESQLPEEVLAQAEKEGATGEIRAVHWQGEIYIVADQMTNRQSVEEAVLHEGSHFQGDSFFGKGRSAAYQTLWFKIGGKKGMRELAQKIGFDIKSYFDTADKLLQDETTSSKERAVYLVDEFLAHARGQQAYESLPARVKRAIKEFIGLIRDLLRKSGFVDLPKANDSDIYYLLKTVNEAVRKNPKAGVFNKVPAFMTFHHASPHKFDKFSMENIGTGEGVQAYGYGLYFAEDEGVAGHYLLTTPYADAVRNFLDVLPEDADFSEVTDMLGSGVFSDNQEAVIKALEVDDWLGFDYPAQAINAAYRELDNYDPSPELVEAIDNSGTMYEVDIPDEHVKNFLDWDTPLSEQSGGIKSQLTPIYGGDDFRLFTTKSIDDSFREKGRYYGKSTNQTPFNESKKFSQFLENKSIPHKKKVAKSGTVYITTVGDPYKNRYGGMSLGDMEFRFSDHSKLGASGDYSNSVDSSYAADIFPGGQSVQDAVDVIENNRFVLNNKTTGKELYELLSNSLGEKQSSDYLNKLGIKGIKYYDAGSRNITDKYQVQGGEQPLAFNDKQKALDHIKKYGGALSETEQTRNIVVFDDSIIEIKKVNGEPVSKQEKAEAIDEMYGLTDGEPVLFKRETAGKAAGVSAETAQTVIDSFKSGLSGNPSALKFVYRATKAKAFGAEAVAQMRAEGSKQVKGAYYPESGTILLIGEDLNNGADVLETLRHEVIGHFGLDLFDADQQRVILDKILNSRNNNTKVMRDLWARIDRVYADKSDDIKAKEVLAAVAENKQAKFQKWWNDLLVTIRKFLKKIGLIDDVVGKPELNALVETLADAIRSGQVQRNFPVDAGLYRRGEDAPIGASLGLPEETYKQFAVRFLQNGFNRIDQLQKEIIKRGGNIVSDSDVYQAEELSSGRTTARLVALDNDHMKPLVDQMDRDNITIEELDEFLMAKHAPERNDYIASVNEDMQDGGSGMTYMEADAVIAKFEDKRDAMEEAAERVYAVNRKHLNDLVAAGHIDHKTVVEWAERWQFYVPLKGIAEEDAIGGQSRGQGYSVRGSGVKAAMGRGAGNIAESPTAHAFAQAESTIVRAEKTKIGQALVNLVRANPDPAFWTINKRTLKRFTDLYGEPFEGYEEAPDGMVEGLDFHRVMHVTKAERKAAKQEGRNPIAKVAFKMDMAYKQRDDVFAVMVEGQELSIQIKDKIVVEQLKRMNASQFSWLVANAGKVNRYLATVNTALNPEFVITNFERDIQTALVHLSGEQTTAMAKKVLKTVPSAARGIWQATFDTKGNSPWRAEYVEMQKEGGTIGFFGLEDIETKVKRVQDRLQTRHTAFGKGKKAALTMRDLILDANLAVENSTRLAAYVASRDSWIANGMPAAEARKKAASLAKNLTVNFNRKGEAGPVINSFYLFFNASIQGSARMLSSLITSSRTRKIVTGMMVMGFMQAMFNRGFGGDDDDDIPKWDKISDYTKQTHMIFMLDGMDLPVKFKMPYGYNIFHYTGTALHDLIFDDKKTAMGTAMSMLSAVMNSWNPLQGADVLDTITPTALKPWEQSERNMNFMGAPIKPEYPFDQYDRPESQKYWKSTNPALKEFMRILNEATGGDETHPGAVDISPETVNHYIKWLFGGAGATVARTTSTVSNLATGEPIDIRNVPFARTAVVPESSYYDKQRFYESIKQVAAVKAQLKLYKGTEKYSDYKAENSEVNKLAFHVTRYKNKVKRLSDKRDKAYADDDTELANEYREEIRQVMMQFSKRYDDAVAAKE